MEAILRTNKGDGNNGTRAMNDNESPPPLSDELASGNHERRPARAKFKLTPGYYDDCAYYEEAEDQFGLAAYLKELADIKRLQKGKQQ